jgi:hypothetical protein
MALERTIKELATKLHRLRDRFQELRLTVVEDRPLRNDAAVVDSFEYAVEDVLGWTNEAVQAAHTAERAAQPPVDVEKVRQAVTIVQERFTRTERVFAASLVSYEKIKDLTSFGSERRGEWPSWVTSVKQGIEHCKQPLDEARTKVSECWQEIAERVGFTSLSVTAIGQQVVPGHSEARQPVEE